MARHAHARRAGRSPAAPPLDPATPAGDWPDALDLRALTRTGTELLTAPEADDADRWLLRDLLPEHGVTLFHGRPRSFKSLAALDCAVSLALGVSALGRFEAGTGARDVLYLSGEDDWGLIRYRLRLLAAGHEVTHEALARLRVLAYPGLPLETDARARSETFDLVRDVRAAAVVLDSVRSLFPGADGGPRDGAALVAFVRELQQRTPAHAVLLVHHDARPVAGAPARMGAERASGGVTFAMSDCPLGFVLTGDRESRVTPSGSKLTGRRPPFLLRLDSAGEPGDDFDVYLRVCAADVAGDGVRPASVRPAPASDLAARILAWLAEHPGSSGRAMVAGLHVQRERVYQALDTLRTAGRVDRTEAGKKNLWSLRPEAFTESEA